MMDQPKALLVLNLFPSCNAIFLKHTRLSNFWVLIDFFFIYTSVLTWKKVFFVLHQNGDIPKCSENASNIDISRFSNTFLSLEASFNSSISVSLEQLLLVEETFSEKSSNLMLVLISDFAELPEKFVMIDRYWISNIM